MEFDDSSRVGGEREVCINRCVIVGCLWAESEREGEGERGGWEREGEGGRGGGGGGGEGTVGIRGQFMFSF